MYIFTFDHVHYLQWTVMGPLAVLRWTRSNISIISMIEFGLVGQEFCGHSTYCNCVMVLVALCML